MSWIAGRLGPESAFSRTLYSTLFKHGSTYMATCMVVAIAAGQGYDAVMNSIWDANNKGKQWKDVQHKFIEADED